MDEVKYNRKRSALQREERRGSKTQIDQMREREKWSHADRKCSASEDMGPMENIKQ